MSKLRLGLIKYGGCAVFTALMAAAYIGLRDFEEAALVDQYLMLCDAFTIPGMLLIMVGCLIWASNLGALNGLSYVVRIAVFSLIPGKRLERDEAYGDYVARKREKKLKGYGFLFISGLIVMAVAMVFMMLFYSLYE